MVKIGITNLHHWLLQINGVCSFVHIQETIPLYFITTLLVSKESISITTMRICDQVWENRVLLPQQLISLFCLYVKAVLMHYPKTLSIWS